MSHEVPREILRKADDTVTRTGATTQVSESKYPKDREKETTAGASGCPQTGQTVLRPGALIPHFGPPLSRSGLAKRSAPAKSTLGSGRERELSSSRLGPTGAFSRPALTSRPPTSFPIGVTSPGSELPSSRRRPRAPRRSPARPRCAPVAQALGRGGSRVGPPPPPG